MNSLEGKSIKLTLNFSHSGTMTFHDSYMEFTPSKLEIISGASIYSTRALSRNKTSLLKSLLVGNKQEKIDIPYDVLTDVNVGKSTHNPLFQCIKISYIPSAFSGGYDTYFELQKNGKEGKKKLAEIMDFINAKIELLKNSNNQNSILQPDEETQYSADENDDIEETTDNVSEDLPLFCPKCGTKFEGDAAFCPTCGNKR